MKKMKCNSDGFSRMVIISLTISQEYCFLAQVYLGEPSRFSTKLSVVEVGRRHAGAGADLGFLAEQIGPTGPGHWGKKGAFKAVAFWALCGLGQVTHVVARDGGPFSARLKLT